MAPHVRVARNGGAMIALAAVLVFFCALTAGGGGGPALISSPIAEAAQRTNQATGVRFGFNASVDVSQYGSMAIQGAGVFNARSGRGRMTMSMQAPPPVGSTRFVEIFGGGAVYMSSPLLAPALPAGKRWVRASGSSASGDAGAIEPQDLERELDMLRSVSDDAAVVGHDHINGALSTHYHASIEPSHVADLLRSRGSSGAADAIERYATPIPVDVWIDGRGLLRRVAVSLTMTGPQQQTISASFSVDLSDYGAHPRVTLPNSGAVIDAGQVPDGSLSPFAAAGSLS